MSLDAMVVGVVGFALTMARMEGVHHSKGIENGSRSTDGIDIAHVAQRIACNIASFSAQVNSM